jgi:hypothetical protein
MALLLSQKHAAKQWFFASSAQRKSQAMQPQKLSAMMMSSTHWPAAPMSLHEPGTMAAPTSQGEWQKAVAVHSGAWTSVHVLSFEQRRPAQQSPSPMHASPALPHPATGLLAHIGSPSE